MKKKILSLVSALALIVLIATNPSREDHEKVIKDLQEQIDLLNHKTKKAKQKEEDTDEQNEDELFTTKKKDKTNTSSMNGTRRTVRF